MITLQQQCYRVTAEIKKYNSKDGCTLVSLARRELPERGVRLKAFKLLLLFFLEVNLCLISKIKSTLRVCYTVSQSDECTVVGLCRGVNEGLTAVAHER